MTLKAQRHPFPPQNADQEEEEEEEEEEQQQHCGLLRHDLCQNMPSWPQDKVNDG